MTTTRTNSESGLSRWYRVLIRLNKTHQSGPIRLDVVGFRVLARSEKRARQVARRQCVMAGWTITRRTVVYALEREA